MSKAITSIKAAASKDAQTRSFEGAITTIIKKRLVGWALERNRPDISVDVDLMVGDVQIGTVTADGFSQELYDRGKGTGFHQFVTVPTLSGEFPGDWVGSVPIRLRASGTHEIFGEPFIVQVQTLRELVANRRIVGKIDGLGDGKIEGWIADLDVEDVAPPLILSLDGKTLSGLRTMRDETIVHQGRVIGGWRFAVQMPPSGRQGRLHLITARSDNTELDGSPMLFGPVPISNIVDAIAAQGRSISELRDRVAVLPAMQSTESLMDTLAERTLDRVDMLMSIYRDNIEHELGVMRNLLVSHLGSSVNGSDPLSVVTAPALPVTRTSPSIAEKIDFTADLGHINRFCRDHRRRGDDLWPADRQRRNSPEKRRAQPVYRSRGNGRRFARCPDAVGILNQRTAIPRPLSHSAERSLAVRWTHSLDGRRRGCVGAHHRAHGCLCGTRPGGALAEDFCNHADRHAGPVRPRRYTAGIRRACGQPV